MKGNAFADAYVWEIGYDRLISYRTGKTVYSECFQQGRLCAGGWNTEGYVPQHETVPCIPRPNPTLYIRPETFAVQMDGVDLNYSFDWAGFETREEPEGLHVMLRLKSVRKPVTVVVHTILDGTDFLQRYLTIENESDEAMSLSGLTILSGALMEEEVPNERALPFELGYMHSAQACREGDFRWTTLPRNTFSFGKHLYEERYRTPFCIVRQKKYGKLFIAQMGFSGGYEFSFHNTLYSHSKLACLSYEAAICSASPLRTLSAGETMQTPSMHFAMCADNFDSAIQALQTHLRSYCGVFEKHSFIESSIGPSVYMSEEMVMKAIDRAADFGAEVFFLDASWYSPDGEEASWPDHCGDWEPREWRYTCSMADFRERAHEKGMRFGLWMDVEKIGQKSQALHNPDIPQLQGYAGRTMDATSGVLDVSAPAGLEWAYQQICGVIDRYQLDFFRLDSGSYAFESHRNVNGRDECCDLRYYENFYGLFRRLRKKYPHVIFQNCSGGGMRIDPGMMQPMSDTQITDNYTAPISFAILNGVSLCVPIDYIQRFLIVCGGHNMGTLKFQLNASRFGVPSVYYNLPMNVKDSPLQIEAYKKMLETYRTHIRPMMADARIYHHTPELRYEEPGAFGVLEMAAADQHCSLLAAFTLSEVLEPVHCLCFRGLSHSGAYDVWEDDEYFGRFSGKELMTSGIRADIPGALDSRSYLAVLAEPYI